MTNSTLSNTENKIKLKIDLRRFLPLATIKYLPEFVGNLELRVQFSIDGLVCAPLGFDGIAGNPSNAGKLVIANASGYTGTGITNKFVPYSELEAGHVVGVKTMTYTAGSSGAPDRVNLTISKISGAGLTTTPPFLFPFALV